MNEIFGARAKVLIRYEGEIGNLSKILSEGLILPDFTVEHREEPPYDLTGSCEALGFELWLNKVSIAEGYNYLLEISTEMIHDEIMNGRMHDLSLWLARFIAKICGANTCVMNETNDLIVFTKEDD